MHPTLLADIAALRQAELLREAETRRLRARGRRPETTSIQAVTRGVSRWRRTILGMIRPQPDPCCA